MHLVTFPLHHHPALFCSYLLPPSSSKLLITYVSDPPSPHHHLHAAAPSPLLLVHRCSPPPLTGERVRTTMGGVASKCSYAKHRKKTKELRAKVLALEEEIKEMKRVREHEARAFERHAAAFASKEAEWEQERRKHREEASKLGKRLKEEEDRIRCLEEEMAAGRGDKEWFRLGTDYLVEHMKEEQARREEAVEKWKQLYLAIKTELDDLIQRTRQGNISHSLEIGAETEQRIAGSYKEYGFNAWMIHKRMKGTGHRSQLTSATNLCLDLLVRSSFSPTPSQAHTITFGCALHMKEYCIHVH
ncbi:hypothetical protein B296_00005417 [Ensete ventricosum]|uniref:Uncharacterized protein n=1 Tax=Ensete ventricosum TaxID=4639 RepID=A0A427BAR8_ENSVE|nr:hypothetical protein B296_00005417 [Ensete ventricosum]